MPEAGVWLRFSAMTLSPLFPCRFASSSALRRLGRLIAGLAIACGIGCSAAVAAPSGGPYGPVVRTYDVPADAAHVIYVAPDGSADAKGDAADRPTTIEAAIDRAVTGDAIILRGGTYRTGGLVINQGVTLQPYRDERPVFKGTEVAKDWTAQPNGLWRISWTKLFPAVPADWWRREREGRVTPRWLFNNDMVFVDGRMLQQTGSETTLDADHCYIDYAAKLVFIAVDPTQHLVEITAHDSALVRTTAEAHGKRNDHRGFVLRGLTFTQYAYRALEVEGTEPDKLADPATFGKDVVGTVLEDCTITHCSRVAAYLRGDQLVVRHCLVSDTSTEGIYVIDSADVLLEKNIFTRNNVEGITGYYPSLVKIFNQSYRVTCRDNLVLGDQQTNGIWYDVGNVDAVFVDNWIVGAEDGFFFEISKGATVAGNVFVDCHKGLRSLNSSGVHAWQNTFVNSQAAFERNERSAVGDHFGWHPSTGPDVDQRVGHVFANNLLVADARFWGGPLLSLEQSPKVKHLRMRHLSQLDGNVYVRLNDAASPKLLSWGPADTESDVLPIDKLDTLRALDAKLEAHGRGFVDYGGPLLRGLRVENYELLGAFPGADAGVEPPEKVRALLGLAPGAKPFPGAYVPER